VFGAPNTLDLGWLVPPPNTLDGCCCVEAPPKPNMLDIVKLDRCGAAEDG